jgi:hypothetical protein
MISLGRRWQVGMAGGMLPLLLLLLAPAATHASCGSHVQTSADSAPAARSPSREHPQPCQGPHCSGRPLGLPDTPPAPPSVSTGKDLSLGPGSADEPDGPVIGIHDEPLARPIHIAPDISRPPR